MSIDDFLMPAASKIIAVDPQNGFSTPGGVACSLPAQLTICRRRDFKIMVLALLLALVLLPVCHDLPAEPGKIAYDFIYR